MLETIGRNYRRVGKKKVGTRSGESFELVRILICCIWLRKSSVHEIFVLKCWCHINYFFFSYELLNPTVSRLTFQSFTSPIMSTSSLTSITTARPRKPRVINLKPPSPRLHTRRHSQSNAESDTAPKNIQQHRSRSLSTSVLPPSELSEPLEDSTLAEQFFASVNHKIREIEDADSTGILRYVDDQVHEKWDTAKAAVVGAQRLLKFHELPNEWQENQYILSG
jgi:hypothetical protein